MRHSLAVVVVTLIVSACRTPGIPGSVAMAPQVGTADSARPVASPVVTDDIPRFWAMFDTVRALRDSSARASAVQRLYVDRGTIGLTALMQARRYTAEQYAEAIVRYPQFWQSVRANTLGAPTHATAIAEGIERMRVVYPALRPAPVYFSMGVLRTPGTVLDGQVLIGAELALADRHTVSRELPANYASLRTYFDAEPVRQVVQLNVHEVVHTQQRDHPYTLLHRALYEGIAEYVSVRAIGVESTVPAIAYGRANRARVRDRFAQHLLSRPAVADWLYNTTDNEFGVRDLGYYVGYAIAEGFVTTAPDPQSAIATLIELDYADTVAVAAVVDASGFLERPLRAEIMRYEASQPAVVRVREIAVGAADVDPSVSTLTIEFSAPMSPDARGFDFGPLGESHVLSVQEWLGFAADRRSARIRIALQPARRYQVLLTDRFRDAQGVPMRPYLLDFTTRRP